MKAPLAAAPAFTSAEFRAALGHPPHQPLQPPQPLQARALLTGLGFRGSLAGAVLGLLLGVGLALVPGSTAAATPGTSNSRAATDTLRDLTLTTRGGKLFQVEGREVYVYTERCRADSVPTPARAVPPASPAASASAAASATTSASTAATTSAATPPASAASAPAGQTSGPASARTTPVDWLRFADGRVCRVRGIYGVLPLANDRYGVQIAYRERDWYEAVGTDMFLRTRRCMHLTLGEKGVLVVMAADDMRLLFADGGSCEVQAAFSRLKS